MVDRLSVKAKMLQFQPPQQEETMISAADIVISLASEGFDPKAFNALESREREQDCHVRMFLTKQHDFQAQYALER